MARIITSTVLVCPILATLIGLSGGSAEEVTIEQLLAKVSVLSPQNVAIESCRFTAVVSTPVVRTGTEDRLKLRFDVAWRKGEDITVLYSEWKSGMPVAFAADQKVLFYDARQATLTWGDGWWPTLDLDIGEGQFQWKLGFTTGQAPRFQVDLRPFFRNPGSNGTLVERTAGTWEFTWPRDRSKLVGIFRPSQFYPLCSLEIRANADGLLLLGVTDIRVNEPVTAQRRRFPPLNGLPPEVEIKEFQVTGAAEAMGVPARLLDVGRRRRELEEPQWRHFII